MFQHRWMSEGEEQVCPSNHALIISQPWKIRIWLGYYSCFICCLKQYGWEYQAFRKAVSQMPQLKKAHETYFTSLNVRRWGTGPPIMSCLEHITAQTVLNLVGILLLLHLFSQTIWVGIPGFPVPPCAPFMFNSVHKWSLHIVGTWHFLNIWRNRHMVGPMMQALPKLCYAVGN